MTENTATFVATVDTRGSVNIPKSIQGLGFVSGVKVRVVLKLVDDEETDSATLENSNVQLVQESKAVESLEEATDKVLVVESSRE